MPKALPHWYFRLIFRPSPSRLSLLSAQICDSSLPLCTSGASVPASRCQENIHFNCGLRKAFSKRNSAAGTFKKTFLIISLRWMCDVDLIWVAWKEHYFSSVHNKNMSFLRKDCEAQRRFTSWVVFGPHLALNDSVDSGWVWRPDFSLLSNKYSPDLHIFWTFESL